MSLCSSLTPIDTRPKPITLGIDNCYRAVTGTPYYCARPLLISEITTLSIAPIERMFSEELFSVNSTSRGTSSYDLPRSRSNLLMPPAT